MFGLGSTDAAADGAAIADMYNLEQSGVLAPGITWTKVNQGGDYLVNKAKQTILWLRELHLQGISDATPLLRQGVNSWGAVTNKWSRHPSSVSDRKWAELKQAVTSGQLALDGPRGDITDARVATVARQIEASVRLCQGMSNKTTCKSNLLDMIRPWEILLATPGTTVSVSTASWNALSSAVESAKAEIANRGPMARTVLVRQPYKTSLMDKLLGRGERIRSEAEGTETTEDTWDYCERHPDRCILMDAVTTVQHSAAIGAAEAMAQEAIERDEALATGAGVCPEMTIWDEAYGACVPTDDSYVPPVSSSFPWWLYGLGAVTLGGVVWFFWPRESKGS